MGNLITIVHPAHGIIGDILTVLLCIPVAALFLFTFLWPLYSFFRDLFGVPEDVPVVPERDGLEALPLGAPRDGGNYIYTGHGWSRLTEEEAEEVRGNLKFAARAKMRTESDGWEVLAPETAPIAHPGMKMEITNDEDGDYDGPDDVPDDDEVERPDEMEVTVFS